MNLQKGGGNERGGSDESGGPIETRGTVALSYFPLRGIATIQRGGEGFGFFLSLEKRATWAFQPISHSCKSRLVARANIQRILAFFLATLIYQPPWCQTRGVAASCCFEVVSHKYDRNESFSRILDRTGGSLPCTCSFTTVILFEKERDFSFFAPWFTLSPRVLFPLTLEISLFSPNKLFLWSYARCAFASFLFREIKFYKLVRFSGHRKSVCPLCDHRRVLYRMLTLDHAKNFRGQRQM